MPPEINERKYIAISIKHSICDKSRRLTLWGWKRTKDEESRCFSDYTRDINKCELYSLKDFQSKYGNSYIKCDESVKMCFELCKKYKKYDTVLVGLEDYQEYLELI